MFQIIGAPHPPSPRFQVSYRQTNHHLVCYVMACPVASPTLWRSHTRARASQEMLSHQLTPSGRTQDDRNARSILVDAVWPSNSFEERCWSGRSGAPGKRVSRLAGTVGSNPTLSATKQVWIASLYQDFVVTFLDTMLE